MQKPAFFKGVPITKQYEEANDFHIRCQCCPVCIPACKLPGLWQKESLSLDTALPKILAHLQRHNDCRLHRSILQGVMVESNNLRRQTNPGDKTGPHFQPRGSAPTLPCWHAEFKHGILVSIQHNHHKSTIIWFWQAGQWLCWIITVLVLQLVQC